MRAVVLPEDVAIRVDSLGHGSLAPRPSLTTLFECPRCGARAGQEADGWQGWALEFTCDQVVALNNRLRAS